MRKAVLIVNGAYGQELPPPASAFDGAYIVAVDGGANFAAAWGVRPHLIIGDLDSIAADALAQYQGAGVAIEPYPRDKDLTDLELALLRVQAQGYPEVEIYNAAGGLSDHAFTNLQLLARSEFSSQRITVFSTPPSSGRFHIMHGPDARCFEERCERVSLIPVSDTVRGVTLSGVRWPLCGAELKRGSTLAMGNRSVDARLSIELGAGTLLLYLGGARPDGR